VQSQSGESSEQKSALPFGGGKALRTILKALDAEDSEDFVAGDFDASETKYLGDRGLLFVDTEQCTHYSRRLRKLVGKELFQCLLPTEQMRFLYFQAQESASREGEPVHLELRFDKDALELAACPWELLYDEESKDDFLVGGGIATLARYILFDATPPDPIAPENLRVLLISPQAATEDYPPLPHADLQAMRLGLQQASNKGVVAVEELDPRTFDRLKARMERDRPQIIHFDGHGVFGRLCRCGAITQSSSSSACKKCGQAFIDQEPEGYLIFDGAGGNPDPVSARDFAGAMGRGRDVLLVVLSACGSCRAEGETLFNGVAQRLIASAVPAVVATHFPIRADKAADMTEQLYRQIASGESLAAAVSSCRTGMRRGGDQWYRPVLYLRSKDTQGGRFFRRTSGTTGPINLTEKETAPKLQRLEDFKSNEELVAYCMRLTERLTVKELEQVAVDQREAMGNFVSMLIPRYRPGQHILVLQAGRNTGKSYALNRFQHICDHYAVERALLSARLSFRGRNLLPRSVATRVLDGLARYAGSNPNPKATGLANDLAQLSIAVKGDLPGGVATSGSRSPEAEWDAMTILLSQELSRLAASTIAVLFFDDCHCLIGQPVGGWFMHSLLPELADASTNLIVVLAAESGLDELESWDEQVKYLKAVGSADWQDIRRLAKLLYGADDFSTETAQRICRDADGDMSKVRLLLDYWFHNVGRQVAEAGEPRPAIY
jgi:hypothetical protein